MYDTILLILNQINSENIVKKLFNNFLLNSCDLYENVIHNYETKFYTAIVHQYL